MRATQRERQTEKSNQACLNTKSVPHIHRRLYNSLRSQTVSMNTRLLVCSLYYCPTPLSQTKPCCLRPSSTQASDMPFALLPHLHTHNARLHITLVSHPKAYTRARSLPLICTLSLSHTHKRRHAHTHTAGIPRKHTHTLTVQLHLSLSHLSTLPSRRDLTLSLTVIV